VIPIVDKINSPHKHHEAPSGLTKEQTRKVSGTRWWMPYQGQCPRLTGAYITPFALSMQATTQQIGFLTSLPNFMNMLTALFTPMISERLGSRKTLLVSSVFVQALMWLPMLLIPYIFHTNQVWWLIAFVSLSTITGALSSFSLELDYGRFIAAGDTRKIFWHA